ncbi:nucleotide exchange factor GrpE [Streptomyces sp. HB132]|uniref:nucleotide exchange factor GrpE n=1 Tax=Streptomyces sp. HB132 TaxID=767388 RepID=UPI001960F5CA|nr:nucleotide exchange factor GrpE [Streptomyces sp. HB132]MBM7440535.1 molecular chaperone GrpE [Streptomyces sp. HB132]
MNDPAPSAPAGPPSELDKLRRRVEALSHKRDKAEARLHALLGALLPLDDLLADTRRRTGALHEARSAREATSAAVALSEQIDAAHVMLRSEFARNDVSPMDAVGRAVDPAEMRVVGTAPHPSAPDGMVLQERVTGFRLGNSTLRSAQVVVAAPGPVPEPTVVPASADSTDPAVSEGSSSGGKRTQPRRTTRSGRQLPRKPSARRGRRTRRA